MNEIIEAVDVIELARQFEVDQSDLLETFVCELLNISPDKLYEILDKELKVSSDESKEPYENAIAEIPKHYPYKPNGDMFDNIKTELERLIEENNWEIPKLVACIYDLYQDYIISETEEQVLYEIADPYEEYNDCSEYWREMDYENPLKKVID